MTVLEQNYLQQVPLYLKQIALNLKCLCDLLSENKSETLVEKEAERKP